MSEKQSSNENAENAEKLHLATNDIHKHFGGIVALSGATVKVRKNSLIALIGPNGSGKTTLFNVITGWLTKTNATSVEDELTSEETEVGDVTFEDEKIDGEIPHEIALRGMLRTFQTTRNFPNLTVLENMLVAPYNQIGESLWAVFFKRKQIRKEERKNTLKALEILEFLEISHIRDQLSSELSGGQLKLLAIGRLLMTAPKMILLDEPLAGVNPSLGNKIMDKIVDLRKETTIFLIEHNMDVVFNYSDEIFVMARGKVIAQGTPKEIQANTKVIDAYLGADY